MLVKEKLAKLGLHFILVELGVVEIMEDLSPEQREQIRLELLESGLELMDDRKAMLVEKIKAVIIDMVHYTDELPKIISKINSKNWQILFPEINVEGSFNFYEQKWQRTLSLRDLSKNIVIFVRVDGGFSLFDPARQRDDQFQQPDAPSPRRHRSG